MLYFPFSATIPYGRPSQRLVLDLADHDLRISPGTLAGGLQAIAPLLEPIGLALMARLRSEQHWHVDETRWAVFMDTEGKVGHRWYLWVFHARSVVHYVLDQARSSQVVADELAGFKQAILSCDRYSAYKKFARLHPGVVLAYCWAHQRRDFLELAHAYPACEPWALEWVPMDNNTAERDLRGPVVGRKNFYASGACWSGQLAATMYSVLATLGLWSINARAWLGAYLQACADNGNREPVDLAPFLPWSMDEVRLAAMRANRLGASVSTKVFDTS